MRAVPPYGGESSDFDPAVLELATRGDARAFERIVEAHQGPVFAVLSRILGPSGRHALVEDLAQETFLRVATALPRFGTDGRNKLSSWILTIATRIALDELKRRVPPSDPIDGAYDLASAASADERVERAQARSAIERAIADLAPEFRATFVLREFHDLEYGEIAETLGVDVGTIKSRLFRAREALRKALSEARHG
jgi:RNA polymerase sigma-70 factor (ECF subfamily)